MGTGLTDNEWQLIVKNIKREQCIPFLGAGASLGFEKNAGLPTAGQLAQMLADECGYSGSDKTDFFRVSQYYVMARDPHDLQCVIRDKLSVPGVKPGIIHNVLASLPFRYILTTNFDDLMEKAFVNAEKFPNEEIYRVRGNTSELKPATIKEPIVYKLHGSIKEISTMITTEDNVIDFLAAILMSEPPLPSEIKSLFTNSSILFIGYGLKDWNIRVMLRALRESGNQSKSSRSSFAIQRCPDDNWEATEWEQSVLYWRQNEHIRCFDVDAVEFMTELGKRYHQKEP